MKLYFMIRAINLEHLLSQNYNHNNCPDNSLAMLRLLHSRRVSCQPSVVVLTPNKVNDKMQWNGRIHNEINETSRKQNLV
ncbi:hypothetical protein ACTXT7_006292 [Hymenolepis weldensis]